MNSFLQMVYMIPTFRHELLQWQFDPELYGDPKDFIPYQLQKLFVKMQIGSVNYVDTKALTKSFKWDSEDAFEQHDVQEFSKVLFEALELSFVTSDKFDLINELFQGESLNYISCKRQGCESSSLEKWLDLQMIIENPFEQVPNDTHSSDQQRQTRAVLEDVLEARIP